MNKMRSSKMSTMAILFLGMSAPGLAVEKEGDNPLDWLRNAIPGEPLTDYPIYSTVEETSFSCDGLIFGGYYADPEMECQAYHVCLQDPINPSSLYPVSFLCPNGTIFSQEIFTCDWWFNVDCSSSTGLYGAAEGAFGGNGASGVGGGENGGGSCPAANPLSPDQCAGAVSNCWSPGFTDTDCPNNGLCCFDGCADLCVDGPKPQPQPQAPKPRPEIIEQESNNLPEAIPTPAPVKTTTGYKYDVPEIPFELPSKPSTPRPGLPTLYGAPPIGRK